MGIELSQQRRIRGPALAFLVAVGLMAPVTGLMAPVTGAAGGAGSAANDPATRKLASFPSAERAIRSCANRHRRAAGLKRLWASGVLAKAARLHARNMAARRFFSHTDHLDRGPGDRVEIFDREDRFVFIGENIAAGYGSVRAACRGWMKSPGHRANILQEGFTAIGAGFARGGPYGRYYVQVFGSDR